MAMSHTHIEGGPVCKYKTKKECEAVYADWQANSQVDLADLIVRRGNADRYRRDNTVFGQLVQVRAGMREDIDGKASFTERIRQAVARRR